MRDLTDNSGSWQASDWFLALRESPGDADLEKRFRAWLRESDEHATEWAQVRDTFALLGESRQYAIPPRESPSRAGIRDGVTGWSRHAGRRLTAPTAAGMIAAMAVAACIAIFLLPGMFLRLEADYISDTAELLPVSLSDGSRIRLAPESAIAVDYGNDARRVSLLRGKAFFDVAPDTKRPFSVSAEGLKATAVGTSFEVVRGEGGSMVEVTHGRVLVEVDGGESSASKVLDEGRWLRTEGANAVSHGIRPVNLMAAWRRGELVVRDRPVAEVVAEIRAYYGGVILLQGEALARQPVTGLYRLDDPVAAVLAVAAAQGARVREPVPGVLVVSRF